MNCNFIGMSNLFHNNKDSSGKLFQGWSFEKENYVLFIAGIVSVILGYIVMAAWARWATAWVYSGRFDMAHAALDKADTLKATA